MKITQRLNKLSIKHKIILISMTTSVIALALAALIIISGDYFKARKGLIDSAFAISSVIEGNAGAAVAFRDPEVANEILSGLAGLSHVLEATITLIDGEQFSSYKSSTPAHQYIHSGNAVDYEDLTQSIASNPDRSATTSNFTSRYFDFSRPIYFDDTQQGIFSIRIDTNVIHKGIIFSVVVVLSSIALSLFLVYLLSIRLQRSVTKPITELAMAFQDVSKSKDYSRRVQSTSMDEIGDLALGFNKMLEVVGERDRELESIVKDLKVATAAKSEFLANMSHEIRTPLHGILGITSLLMQMPESNQKCAYYKTIDDSANALLQIINDILDLSRIEAGRFEPEESEFELKEVVKHIQNLFESNADNKGISFEVALAADTPLRLKGDSRRLTQMLVNLVGNAIKFTSEGSVSVEISARDISASLATILFEVSDTGIGINEESQKLVFNDFSQVDASISRRFGGTGLGLSVSKSIADLLGGEIGLESVEGKGSRFWFSIPFKLPGQASSGATASELPVEKPNASAPDTKTTTNRKQYQARVLLADDSGINQFIMVETLKTFGLDTLTVDSGREAIEARKNDDFDLIIMDIQMPDIDGIEAAKKIRHWEQINAVSEPTPIIAFSASAMQGDRERFLKAGMDDYLSKPVQIDGLDLMLERWLGHCQSPA